MMTYRILADLVVVVHFLFVLFALFGALLLLRSKRYIWLHLPAVLWAGIVELAGWECPLTPLEVHLRVDAGELAYRSGFVEHYILPLLYPENLTRQLQIVLGLFVLSLNLCLYGWALTRAPKKPSASV